MKRFKITLFGRNTTCELSRYKTTLKQQLNEIQTHEKVQNNAIWKKHNMRTFKVQNDT